LGIDIENIDLIIPRIELLEILLLSRFLVPISNEPGIEGEVIIVPIPTNPTNPIGGLSSTINLAPISTTSSFYSL
jgi:hypothetical protein